MPRFRKAGVALKQCVGLETVRTLLKGEVLHLVSGGTIILAPSLPCQGHPCTPSPSLWQGWCKPSFRVCPRSCPGPWRHRPGAVGQRGTNWLRQPRRFRVWPGGQDKRCHQWARTVPEVTLPIWWDVCWRSLI